LNETLHHPPAIQQGNHSIRQVFTQSGSKGDMRRRPDHVCSIPDIVAKVENRTTLKISRKSIFGLLCYCVAFQRNYGGP
jgi:hypothetical protein